MIPFWRKTLLRMFRVHVRYTQSVKTALDRQPVILTCNHLSLLDGVLIALASPRPLVYAVMCESNKVLNPRIKNHTDEVIKFHTN